MAKGWPIDAFPWMELEFDEKVLAVWLRIVFALHPCECDSSFSMGPTTASSDGSQSHGTCLSHLQERCFASSLKCNSPCLDPALQLARDGLSRVQQGVNDYTAVIVKRERVNDELGDHEYMFAKVRNRKVQNGQVVVPFSVYLMFLKPTSIKGREVVYVENRNDGKMTAHEGGMKRMLGTHHLEPTSWLAMQGQRYPITDLGIEMLLSKLIERGERSKTDPECKVSYTPNAKVSKRPCNRSAGDSSQTTSAS